MNLPADSLCCLAHEQDHLPRNKFVPPKFCERHQKCVRHQVICMVPYNVRFTVKHRVCQPGEYDQFISRDAVESEGGES